MEKLLAGPLNHLRTVPAIGWKTRKGSVRENSTKEAGTAKGLVLLKKETNKEKQAGKMGEILPRGQWDKRVRG